MNPLEIHIAIRNELDKTQDFQYPDFQPEQIDYWANKAYELWIDDTAYPMVEGKLPFEYSQKRIDELRELVKTESINTSNSQTDYVVQLPNDYRHLVRHECNTTKGNVTKLVSGIITKQDLINLQKKDPFWKPISDEPLYFITGNQIIYETNGSFSVDSTKLTYIKNPIHMRLGTEYTNPTTDISWEITNIYVIHQIINRTVSMMLENIESPRYQTNLNEYNKTN